MLGRLQGIGPDDIETTFGGAYYGAENSIRTDVVLRNEAGDIVAIYDVKTGGAGITSARAADLRAKTGTSSEVPIIELSIRRGVTHKSAYLQKDSTIFVRRAFGFQRRSGWQWN
jgi:hypothetical protein